MKKGYRPSESRYDGGGRVKYLVYHAPQRLRDGKQPDRVRSKRLYFPADATEFAVSRPGTVVKQTGRKVHGVEVTYRYTLAAARAQRGQTEYRVPARMAERTKVVELPDTAKSVRLVDRLPEGAGVAVA